MIAAPLWFLVPKIFEIFPCHEPQGKSEIRISKSETNSNIEIQNHPVGEGIEFGAENDLSEEDENSFGEFGTITFGNHPGLGWKSRLKD